MTGVAIELPFPPATLSGHNKGHWHSKAGVVKKHREWARLATLAAHAQAPVTGDIRVSITFYPPNRRGDRVNFPNRLKPYFDGIADALKVNDSRFVPAFHYAEPVEKGRVVVIIGARQGDQHQRILDQLSDAAVKKILVMRWHELEEITPERTAELIHDNGLEAA